MEETLIREISIVPPPFIFDSAGTYFDTPPDFPEETWAERDAEKREQFDVRWPRVQFVLGALEALNIDMVDVPPSNIAFLDRAEELKPVHGALLSQSARAKCLLID